MSYITCDVIPPPVDDTDYRRAFESESRRAVELEDYVAETQAQVRAANKDNEDLRAEICELKEALVHEHSRSDDLLALVTQMQKCVGHSIPRTDYILLCNFDKEKLDEFKDQLTVLSPTVSLFDGRGRKMEWQQKLGV